MREILFRGKRVDNGDWVYGFYWYDQLENRHMIQSIEFLKNGWNQKVIPDTVGQYTGLTDKNGKKIFEGDRVRCWGGEYYHGIWEFDREFEVNDIRDLEFIVHTEFVEIIENLFDGSNNL